jgi:hypothetical protein
LRLRAGPGAAALRALSADIDKDKALYVILDLVIPCIGSGTDVRKKQKRRDDSLSPLSKSSPNWRASCGLPSISLCDHTYNNQHHDDMC